MLTREADARSVRWIARIWTVLVVAIVLIQIVTPDPNYVRPVPPLDWLILSLWGVAVLGLIVAWRWELVGALITIATMLLRELLWVTLKGPWSASFLIVWFVVVTPACMFLAAWAWERSSKRAPPGRVGVAERSPG